MDTKRDDEFLRNRIKNGKVGSMPAFGSAFSDVQTNQIIKYIYELKSREGSAEHLSRPQDDATSCLPLRGLYGNCRSPLAASELSGAGRMTRNKLPSILLFASSICPPFACTAQRAIASPSPTPPPSLERLASTR